ncbi:unnamed protein product [Mytilus coruscus]|uniref:Uncharacterized protein n=1 Tax=Mytilus coruscus TaxID=42192 RepID=A0A6J8BY80_MYTCO|nr:unnamed protein product [Mytilus coruscus]
MSMADEKLSVEYWRFSDGKFGPHYIDLMAFDSNVMLDANGQPLKHFTPFPYYKIQVYHYLRSDQAFFKLQYLSCDRGNDLGLVLIQEVKRFQGSSGIMFSHTVGKTLGNVNSFLLDNPKENGWTATTNQYLTLSKLNEEMKLQRQNTAFLDNSLTLLTSQLQQKFDLLDKKLAEIDRQNETIRMPSILNKGLFS